MRTIFGDEPGSITNRICGACGSFVYENLGVDPNNKFDVWVYICVKCDERLMPFMALTQKATDERKALVAELERTRFERARDRKVQQQMLLWEDADGN